MRLSRPESVLNIGKHKKFRSKFKGKKKHKRLDAICEKTYNRSHQGVQNVDSNELNDAEKELELRRSSRARRAPVLLDSSPRPPKKRQKVNDRGSNDKVSREFGMKYEPPCSSSRNLDGQNGAWGSRLRFKGKWTSVCGSSRGESSLRGKRKLFDDFDGFREDMEIQRNDKKVELVDEKSTIVKSKRPGRIKASNVLANEREISLADGGKDDIEYNRDEVFEGMKEGERSHLEIKLEVRSDVGINNGNLASDLRVREVAASQKKPELGEGHNNVDVEIRAENMGIENLACDIVPEQQDIDEAASQRANGDGYHDKPLEDETYENLNGKDNALDDVDRKPRIRLGRRCGLCGGGTDGKPPRLFVPDGMGSDNETYSGSSASDEYNYDVWDGFGDESGWLGRLLGPINDRHGIAGIWVHQQCAVWSPEVYFAGLGCLKNVRAALYRGRMLKCNRCKRPGATIGCRVDRCPKTYHLPCARAKGCIFDHRKFLIACTDHRHLFQPHGIQNERRLKKMKVKKMRLEIRKMSNDAHRKDIEVEEKWLENCGEDEEFRKRESKRLHRDLCRIAPVYIGGNNSEKRETQFEGWESVAGLQHVIQCMKEVVILPLLYPEYFKNLGLTPPRGVLLHGYPGTGKTLVVRALVGSCAQGDKRIAYFARKGADCLGKYVGDAERQLRLLFQVAEKSQPSIIFFDEIDGLAPCRSKRQDQTHSSVVSTLLALMDGLKSRGSVIVIGATNRPEAVDPALRRPGRFDREIYFPLPLMKDREAILSLHTRKWPKPIGGSLLKWVAKKTVGFAGADLQALCTQAAIIALKRSFPLQEVLSAAETNASRGQFPPIPSILVEERDWLQAFSCAPPPCSQREGGTVVNDVVSSPLDTHLAPCLLQPLMRLLVLLKLDEDIWLPLPLSKASTLVKNVIVSALDRRRVQSDNWWSHADLLQEVDVIDEIMKNLCIANILVGENRICGSDVIEDNTNETYGAFYPPNLQNMGSHTVIRRNMSYATYNKLGFHMLISGNPRAGQRHLASCLLHCFVGNVDIWKVDLPSISQEGHGDMVHGLTRILMRCAGTNLCVIYMPRIDLWAIESCNEGRESNCDLSSTEPQSPEKLSLEGKCEIDMERDVCPVKVSYLWTLFIEQVESVCVNTSLIILATSELPLSLLPHRVRLFFGSDNASSILGPLDHKVPHFSVQLDGKFDHDKTINTFVARLSRDMVQHFLVSIYGRYHTRRNSLDEKTYDVVEGVVDRVCDGKSGPVHSLSSVPFVNKSIKGKSSLLFAISIVGYQILCYPHFAELCWVTSKLKEGPHANMNGPWKNWPFNSCILRPINSTEKAVAASGSSNIRSKESGLIRGLVAIGLSAYRGEYTSLREVCCDVRKVLEILVERIDDKVKAGKDRTQFFHLLSQVAYLEDMIFSWAYALQSLEVDPCVSAVTTKACVGSLHSDDICKHGTSQGGDSSGTEGCNKTMHGPELLEESLQEVAAKEDGTTDTATINDNRLKAGDEGVDFGKVLHQLVVLDHPSHNECSLPPNYINLESPEAETDRDKTELGGNAESFKLPNGVVENGCHTLADGHCDSGEEHGFEFSSANATNLACDLFSTKVHILCKDTTLKPSCFTSDSVTCIYQCCPDCIVNLQNLLLRNINIEWQHRGTDTSLEGVHDFLSSVSANLHSTLSKLSKGEFSCVGRPFDTKYKKQLECQKCKETLLPECKSLEPKLMNCGCHSKTEKVGRTYHSRSSSGLNFSFVFRDGVLVSLDEGMDVSYHCKFEKLCLCFLIEGLVMSKQEAF